MFTTLNQVTWELVPELDSPLPSFTDLLFLGSRGSSVSDFQPRNHTGTVALMFSGLTESVVTVPNEHHPPIITNELTIRYITIRNISYKYSSCYQWVFYAFMSLADVHTSTVLSNCLLYSLWLLMAGGASGGVLVAKTTGSGSTTFYSLEVTANGDDFLIRLSYLPASRTVLK